MKKILAVLLSLVMAFTFMMPAFAVEENVAEENISSIVDDANEIQKDIEEGDYVSAVTGAIEFIERLFAAIHNLIDNLSEVFEFDCPLCNGPVILPADPTTLEDVLAVAKEGEIVSLAAGDYEVITLGTLNGVTISAEEGAVVDYIATTAETALTNVTLQGFDLEVTAGGEYGILIDPEAVIDNLVIEDTIFTGPATVKNCYGIKGNNVNATMTVRNCTFKDTGYAIYSTAPGGYAGLTFEGCSFDNIYSWVILVQYGFTGDLTITGCNYVACEDGISKNGAFAEGKTFTFTNNTVGADCAGHDGKDSKWFELKTASAVVSGNTYGGVEWIPGAEQGIKAL